MLRHQPFNRRDGDEEHDYDYDVHIHDMAVRNWIQDFDNESGYYGEGMQPERQNDRRFEQHSEFRRTGDNYYSRELELGYLDHVGSAHCDREYRIDLECSDFRQRPVGHNDYLDLVTDYKSRTIRETQNRQQATAVRRHQEATTTWTWFPTIPR